MILRVLAGLLCLGCVVAQEDEIIGRIEDSSLDELSGIVRAREGGRYWAHNDSGDRPRVYGLEPNGALRVVLELQAVARDWEDIACLDARDEQPAQLFLGDIGDNRAQREHIVVYRLDEPELPEGVVRMECVTDTLELSYPDGAHDAEVLLIQPPREGSPGRILIVTKRHLPNQVYGCTLPPAGSARLELEHIGAVQGILDPMITGGDLSPDGSLVVLRTYTMAFEWDVREGDVAAALTGRSWARRYRMPEQKQGEALCYTADGKGLVTVSEGENPPLYRLVR